MFRELEPYPAYADSEPDWPALPEGWTTSRLRAVSTLLVSNVDKLTKEDELPVRLCNYVDVYKHDYITDRPGYMKASASEDEIRRFKILIDDVVITKDSESWSDIGVPTYAVYESDDLVCGYHLALLRTHKERLTGAYLFRALQAPVIAHQFHVAAGGVTRYGLSQDDIKSAGVPIPPLDEQAAIVKYLRHAHARIDRAIAAKRKLIALLEEQKQAIINQAVTRGLDPNAPMKDSGIPWLGQIPVAWELQPARRLLRAVVRPPDGNSGPQFSMTRAHGLVPTDALGAGAGRAANGENLQVCEVGDFVLNKYRAHLGLFRCARERGRVTRNYTVFERRVEISTEYIEMLMHSTPYSDAFRIMARGVGDGMSPLYTSTFYGIPVVFPPPRVQAEIALFVAEAMKASAAVASRLSDEIRLLLEFRTRLTSDVVSGQLDVREVASTLPDLVEPSPVDADSGEDELLDELDEVLEEADA